MRRQERKRRKKRQKRKRNEGCVVRKTVGSMNKKILFVSLGCDKNLVDSEMMLGMLLKNGYEFTDDEREADVVVVNTCCFIGDAKEESVNTILEMAEWKKEGRLKGLIVTGCLAERYQDEILEELRKKRSAETILQRQLFMNVQQ